MKRAPFFVAAGAAVFAAEGWLLAAAWHITYGHGLYCVLGVASTVGCDAEPPGVAGRLAAVVVILTCIPLLAAAFSWLTGKHAARHAAAKVEEHLAATEKRIAEEAGRRHEAMKTQLSAHCADIKQHVSAAADAQASEGPDSRPGESRLAADEHMGEAPAAVPPRPASRKIQRPKGM